MGRILGIIWHWFAYLISTLMSHFQDKDNIYKYSALSVRNGCIDPQERILAKRNRIC